MAFTPGALGLLVLFCSSCIHYADADVTLKSHVYTVGESENFVEVCVLLTPAASQITVVSINTTEISATEADFNLPSNKLIFAIDETIQCASIIIFDDNVVEGDEMFIVEIFSDDAPINLGNSISAVFITDNDIPLAPNNVQAESGLRSLAISWSRPENVESLVDYEVVASAVVTPDVSASVMSVIGVALSAVVGGLSAFTEYGVAVRACSQAGCGPSSPTIQQLTFEEAPSAPPTELRCMPQQLDEVVITWGLPLMDMANGIITKYTITYLSFNSTEEAIEMTVPDNVTSLSLTNLTSMTLYTVTVQAVTVGPGPPATITCLTEGPPLTFSPRMGTMLGGTPVAISGPTFSETSIIVCSFDGNESSGVYINDNVALCVTPAFESIGWISLNVTIKLESGVIIYTHQDCFYSAQPEAISDVRIESANNLVLFNETTFQVTWDPQSLLLFVDPSLYLVDIKLYILSNESQEYELFGDLATNHSNCGEATLSLPRELTTVTNVFSFLVEVSIAGPVRDFLDILDEIRRIIDYLEHRIRRWTNQAIGAFVGAISDLVQLTPCELWCLTQPQGIGEKLLRSVRPCPLTAQRARLPNSGFREDAGILRRILNSIFHPGAATCFRQVLFDQNQECRDAGNQCCYDKNGYLITDPPGAGTVDRVSPEISVIGHFFADVLPSFLCSLDQRSRDIYLNKRPIDRRGLTLGFRILRFLGNLFGDPHILTLDGLSYTFNGLGEFMMINSDNFTLQGRMVQATDNNGNLAQGTVFSAFVADDSTSGSVQFQMTTVGNLEVLVDKKLITFLEELEISEARFGETILIKRGTNDFVVTFASGVYMEIKAENGIISQHIIVLPESFMGKTSGLLGNYNGEQSDDLLPRNEIAVIPTNFSLEEIHNNFGITWIINQPEDSLFAYREFEDWSTYYRPEFQPQFEVVFNNSELEQNANEVCGDEQFCRFDIAATGRTEIGLATRDSVMRVEEIFELSLEVICDPPCATGVCVNNNTCICSPGYTGELCNMPIITECDVNPCENGGNCSMVATVPVCECSEEYNGSRCEMLAADECKENDIRLIGGQKNKLNEGRVEVCAKIHTGQLKWGAVCSDGWDKNDATVACRQLKMPADNAVPLPNFGGGIGPIHMDEVCCKGNENSLFECPRLTIHDCDHDQDAGIRCEDPSSQKSCLPPCINGECSDNNTCVCSPGYTGEVCDVPIIIQCDANPCENGGNCSMVAISQVCDCPDGFKGQKCEISILRIAVEKSVYSVVEGEYLDVCIVVTRGTVIFSFSISIYLTTPMFSIHESIHITVGVTIACTRLHIPDLGLFLEYFAFKEFLLEFYLESPELANTISLQTNQSWIHIIDNDIVHLGLSQHIYEVNENNGSVNVCFELMDGALTGRPIVLKAYSSNGSAIAGSDYTAVEKILSLPVGSESGDKICIDVAIIDDNVVEETEQFVVHLLVHDLNVDVPMAYAYADVHIIDDDAFVIKFGKDSPMVNGDQVFISFLSSAPVVSAMCSLTTQPTVDCSSGSAVFGPLPPNRRRRYTVTIEATSRDETMVIERRFRSETTGRCAAHLTGEGVIVEDGTVSILLQPTGPSEETRLSEFECRLNSNMMEDFFLCGRSPVSLAVTPGDHEVDIRPYDPNQTCSQVHTLSVTFTA